MNILVTGASGFIGSHIIDELNRKGHNVSCTYNRNTKKITNVKKDMRFCLSEDGIGKLILFLKDNKIDGIIHLAAFVQSGSHSIYDIDELLDSNIKFGTLILEAAVQANVKWFINTGSYWQYYNNSQYSPVNLYAASKMAFETIAKYYVDLSLINFNTVMLYDTYGVNDKRPKIFNLWEKMIFTGECLDMSPGEQLIDISYIDDIVEAFICLVDLLQAKAKNIKNGSVFAVKAQKRYTLKELAKIFESISGKKLNINWGERPYRLREIMTPCDKYEVIPGWKPKVSIDEGIRKILKQI